MASEKTPNLGLNQIDRTSPKTTYFDLEKYLDQNWRAVDDFAGDVNDGVNEIKKRLDTTERKAVTLEPGVQIVHAEKASPFSLTGMSGRMLVNLLGRMGNCETVSEWSSNVAIAMDSNNKTNGSSSFKITLGSVPATASASFLTTPGRKYIAIADVKSGNTSKVAISINGIASVVGNEVSSGSVFAPSVVRFTAKEYFHIVTITGTGAAGNIFNMDCVRVYEISEADYADSVSLTPAQAASKYPYVDSVMPVRNPYAIRYGENLLPSFYEWSIVAQAGTAIIIGPNQARLDKSAGLSGFNTQGYKVNAVPATDYTLSVTVDVSNIGGTIGSGAYWNLQAIGKNGEVLADFTTGPFATSNGTKTMVKSFTTPASTSYLQVIVGLDIAATGTAVFRDVSINIGSTAEPFKPREDSMLVLQTDLYADPVTGANADTVFERDGQYFKSKKWQGLTLDGSMPWTVNTIVSGTGFKAVQLFQYAGIAGASTARNALVSKYDGRILDNKGSSVGGAADQHNGIYPTDNAIVITVGVADSGWGDGYNPTQDDIKAYFYGYKAYDANTITPTNAQAMTTATWSGTGTKYWVQRVGAANFTQSVPQTSYVGYTPYQLVYQLATPTVEPIVSEGQLSFFEGDNQIEVGTGIVLREPIKPTPYYSGAPERNRWCLNRLTVDAPNPFKGMPRRVLQVYGNGLNEQIRTGTTGDLVSWYGGVYVDEIYAFSPEKSYSVTYLLAAPSPIPSFVGSYAANEKTLLADLVESVQQADTRVSVLENKKADKDNPAWITPTLLNGWATSRPVGIMKDSTGFVHIRGLIVNGLTNGGLALFTLPQGYRPISIQSPVSYGYGPNGPVLVQYDIFPDGRVCFGGGGAKDSTSVSLLFPPFIAEQ
ncbi:hypothetical protein [Paenibacillus polymyxa]|uniref:hypothetical protein n=1 Tax=Paenibacillus polymyxa TaxID=1406 RepID=UPI002AB59A67|nr:hypothetical protein [Paenibacillus polymyxa]MDY8022849.1 hypothetical protein [Paenibacillus polymyxa]